MSAHNSARTMLIAVCCMQVYVGMGELRWPCLDELIIYDGGVYTAARTNMSI
jgi:hypothetical protein